MMLLGQQLENFYVAWRRSRFGWRGPHELSHFLLLRFRVGKSSTYSLSSFLIHRITDELLLRNEANAGQTKFIILFLN